jgi:hypothetical protein
MDEKALRYATQRVEDFIRVQRGNDDKQEAIRLLYESVGVDEDAKDYVLGWWLGLELDNAEYVMMGLLVGLFIGQYREETES